MFKSKWILVAVLLCVLLPFAANATITRVIGLGGADANYIIKDASNPQIWPQLVADWPNLAGAEFYTPATGVWDFHKAYLNYSFPNASVVSIAVDNLPGIRSMFYGDAEYTAVPPVQNLNGTVANTNASKLSVNWGMPLTGMKIGAALNVAQHSYKDAATPTANELKASLIGINLGASFLEDKLDAAVGFETVTASKKPGTGGSEDKSDGSMAINIAARYWWMYAEKLALVPNIRFLNMKDGGKLANGDKSSVTTTDIKIGVGHNWTPVENTLAIFELGLDMRTEKNESTTSSVSATVKTTENDLPYWRLGFETKVFSWLNGRLGAERNWVAEKVDVAPSPEAAFSQTNLYVGATANWNRLYLDLLVEPSFFQAGPNFISGYNNNMFTRVSLKYDFNK